MISVLIPTYNYDVRELVKKIHEQCTNACIDFEIYVRDDLSTNQEIRRNNSTLKSLINLSYSENSENLGRTATRSKLATAAAYDWILFLDADVLPTNASFISNYISQLRGNTACICGGVTYTSSPPNDSKMLRWVYGKARETKTAAQRLKNPYDIVSPNLCIKKSLFLICNPKEFKGYGMDIIFSDNLKAQNAAVTHIDNPVDHLGLESSAVFLEKSLKAVTSSYEMEAKKLLANNARPLQRVYLTLQRMGAISTFQKTYAFAEKRVVKNLLSKNPSLRLFDAYKLNHYIKLKNNG